MKYLLDTNIISEIITKQPHQKVLDFIENLPEENIYLSVITIGEIKFGIQKVQSPSRKKQLLLWLENDLLQRFDGKIININTATMLTWGEINQHLQSIGRTVSIMDSLIAATAITNQMTLVTRNVKDFNNFNLKIINPFI